MRFQISHLILSFSLLIITSSSAQIQKKGPEIIFDHLNHDFGRISEEILYAKHRFEFTNTGDEPLLINNVQTSCGCTTPDWTRDPVQPGQTGYVDAKYETINRLGTFKKTLTVYTNAENSSFVHLDISGDVYKEKTDGNGMALPDLGKLYFDMPTVEFAKVYDNASDTEFVRLVNATPYSTEIKISGELPPYCRIVGLPASLEPNESAKVQIILDGTKMKSYGFGAFEIPVSTDNPVMPYMGLYVAHTRKQYFPVMSAKQLKKAPKISFDKTLHDFGNHQSGDVMNTEFVMTNTGKSDLILHEIFPECSCVRVQYEKKILLPGESMVLKVRYDSVNKAGVSNQGIWIVCNDPTQDELHIYLRATLPEKNFYCPTCK